MVPWEVMKDTHFFSSPEEAVWVCSMVADGQGETARPARNRVGRMDIYHISSVLTIKTSLIIFMPWFIILYFHWNIDLITGSLWCPFHVKKMSLGKKLQTLATHKSRSSEENFQQDFKRGWQKTSVSNRICPQWSSQLQTTAFLGTGRHSLTVCSPFFQLRSRQKMSLSA